MKSTYAAALIATMFAAPVLAQDTVANPAGTAASTAPASSATTSRFSLDTPLGELMANPAARAVVEAQIPGMDKHPSYDMAKGMSLKQIQPYASAEITDEVLTKIGTGLAAIK